jgi:glycosyltransferase involved in cell wall biosynthesis
MKILVVVPTHDRTEFLDDALHSLAEQTLKPDQIIVTGNVGPSPSYQDSCTYVNSDECFSNRVNAAIESSDCDAFLLLCDDDTLLPEYIERTVALMEEKSADIVYTEYNNEPVTSLIRKSIWRKVGGICEIGFWDWDFYWSCREAGALSLPIREHLFEYRKHQAQMDAHGRLKADGTWAQWEAAILAKHPNRGNPC